MSKIAFQRFNFDLLFSIRIDFADVERTENSPHAIDTIGWIEVDDRIRREEIKEKE